MKLKNLTMLGASALAVAMLAGCGSDGIDVNVESPTTGGGGGSSSPTPPPGTTNPCASYDNGGTTIAGAFDSINNKCTYDANFVSDTTPLTVDLTIAALANNGVHVFEDSLWVGEDVDGAAAGAGTAIPQEGDGPTLTVGQGTKIAFSNPQDYIRIARGSKIVAEGTASNPIIFSGIKDLIDGNATEGDRGLWGGIQINGNGFTNKCSMAGNAPFDAANLTGDFAPTASNPHDCHVTAEGRPATYGGVNNAESSGSLRYVQIRYAGYEVVDGDELNGLTLNAVGSGTTIEYVETYTTQDDGFELFGGAVNLKHIVIVNAGDDSIDYSEGYTGNIQYALVLHTSGGNRCIEGDNTGDTRDDDIGPFTKLRISNMTCITSNVDENQGLQPSSKGDSEGPLYREGVYFEQYNSIITSADPGLGMASNECFEVTDTSATTFTSDAITAGISVAKGNLIACTEALKPTGVFDINTWFNNVANGNAVIDDGSDGTAALPASIITDLSTNPRAYITSPSLQDGTTAIIPVVVYDVTQLSDTFAAQAVPAVGASGSSTFFETVNFIGAVKTGEDWVSSWTVGF